MKFITVTDKEANEILAILSDLPIRYLQQVAAIQQWFAGKFKEWDYQNSTPMEIPDNVSTKEQARFIREDCGKEY